MIFSIIYFNIFKIKNDIFYENNIEIKILVSLIN